MAASVLLRDTFVDDILSGSNSEDDAFECQTQLITLCSQAHFELRKWASNNIRILQSVTDDARAMSPSVLIGHDEQSNLKILGLKWNPYEDTFSFTTQPSSRNPTKRSVLSDIARVFDPLGLLSPITFWTKHIMQQLWTSGIKWDDQIPTDITVQWARYRSELKLIEFPVGLLTTRSSQYNSMHSLIVLKKGMRQPYIFAFQLNLIFIVN